MYCNKFDSDQQLFGDIKLPSTDINTLVLDQGSLGTGSYSFPSKFIANLNIGNLIIRSGYTTVIDTIQFNKKSLKILTLKDVITIGIQWPEFGDGTTKSSVKSIHIEGGGPVRIISRTFGSAFPQLEFATFTNCQLHDVETDLIQDKVNAFEMLKKLKFLTLSHNQFKHVKWLVQSEPKGGSYINVRSYKSLVRLDLSYNQITFISSHAFTEERFPRLKYLDLKHNQFTLFSEYIEPPMFNQLTELWVDIDHQHILADEIKPDNTVKVFYYIK